MNTTNSLYENELIKGDILKMNLDVFTLNVKALESLWGAEGVSCRNYLTSVINMNQLITGTAFANRNLVKSAVVLIDSLKKNDCLIECPDVKCPVISEGLDLSVVESVGICPHEANGVCIIKPIVDQYLGKTPEEVDQFASQIKKMKIKRGLR